MMSSSGNNKGIGLLATGVICIVAYLIGHALSPSILPIDFLTSKLQHVTNNGKKSSGDEAAASVNGVPDAPTPSTPPTALPKTSTATTAARRPTDALSESKDPPTSPHETAFREIVFDGDEYDPFRGVDIVVHRNGEPDPCSRLDELNSNDDATAKLSPASEALLRSVDSLPGSKHLDDYSKYDFDAIFTHALVVGDARANAKRSLLQNRGDSCAPTWKDDGDHYMDSAPHLKHQKVPLSSMIKYCDMGLDKTPIQLDHEEMVPVPEILSKPCHFHTREGIRVTSLEDLAFLAREAEAPAGECAEGEADNADDGTCGGAGDAPAEGAPRELHLYAVQAGRVFMFAPKYVGEIFRIRHAAGPRDLPVHLEVLSLSPRVLDVVNFFDRDESAAIVDKALKETADTHRMKRSSTGASGYNVNSQRTSENGFDTHGKEAQAVKKRCLDVLGFDSYEESLTDGLQVLRYNVSTAYVPHLDWIDDYQKQQEHDFDTAHMGSNRFATILLYMSDLEEGDGGETVFSHGWPPNQAEEDRVQLPDALAALRESGDVESIVKPNSWEEKMVAKCRSRLAVRPHSSRAVLFYSQNPDGTPDSNSMHGGCPVIKGEKWAANLWVWNAPRGGFPGSPKNKEVVERNRASGKQEDNAQKKASFVNSKKDESMKMAKLYFQETFWADLGHSVSPVNVNTYEGHQWNVKVDEKTVKTFVIDKRNTQTYTV